MTILILKVHFLSKECVLYTLTKLFTSETGAGGERDENTEGENFCSEDPHFYHHEGGPHLEDRGEGGQEECGQELLARGEAEKCLGARLR